MSRTRGIDGARWRELKALRPIERTYRAMPASARDRNRPGRAKHTRTVTTARQPIGIARARRHQAQPDGRTWRMVWDPSPDPAIVHTTQRPPWLTKADRRRRNRLARASRKVNRS